MIQYMEEQPQVYASSPQYLQPQNNKDYQYYPTHQNYTQYPANGTLSVRPQILYPFFQSLSRNEAKEVDSQKKICF